jgi:hypothetical protein
VSVRPRPKWLVGATQVPQILVSGTPDNMTVSGYWRFYISTSGYDNLVCLLRPVDTALVTGPVIQSINSPFPIPSGTEIKSRAQIRLSITSDGMFPWYEGVIEKVYYYYNDGTGTIRALPYWRIEAPGGWKKAYVPYHLKMELVENGQVVKILYDNIVIVGPGMGDLYIPEYDITIRNLGMLPQGYLPPVSEDMAVIYLPDGPRIVRETDLKALLKPLLGQTYPGPCKVDLKWTNASGDGSPKVVSNTTVEVHDTSLLSPWSAYFSIVKPLPTNEPKISISADLSVGAGLKQPTLHLTAQAAGAEGFIPNSWSIDGIDVYQGSIEKVYIEQQWGTGFTLYVRFPKTASQNSVLATVRLRAVGAADTWTEVVKQMALDTLQPMKVPLITSSPPSWMLAVYGGALVWDEEKDSPYKEVLDAVSGKSAGTFGRAEGKVVLAGAETRTDFAAQVMIDVPLSLVESYAVVRPNGDPEILDKHPEMVLLGGMENTVSFRVRNRGLTGDTFVTKISLPEGENILWVSGSQTYIPVGETKEMAMSLRALRVEKDHDIEVPFTVMALGSFKTDSGTLKIHLKAGYAEVVLKAQVTVYVSDAKTRVPIEGATVFCAGKGPQYTNSYGTTIFSDVNTGPQEVLVSKRGYYTRDLTYQVSATSSNLVTVELTPVGEKEISPLLIAAIVSAIAVGSGAAYYFYYKRKRP